MGLEVFQGKFDKQSAEREGIGLRRLCVGYQSLVGL